MSSPPAPVASLPQPPAPLTRVCANCGAALAGEYCAACGQRHEPHIHTVAHFASEAVESISHADSRLWRTLWYLFARPGFLTREFFAGRRARYLPPFRLYLVLSVVFFLITGLSGGAPSSERAVGGQNGLNANAQLAADALRKAGEDSSALEKAAQAGNVRLQLDFLEDFCAPLSAPETGGAGAAKRQRIRKFCARMHNDSSVLVAEVVHNLPRAMFLFLPLLALVMKLLYWRPKRYYVEHLLFLVHNHASVFFSFSILELMALVPALDAHVVGWLQPLWMLYMVWYVYSAMRNVYKQNHLLTLSKYVILGFSYFVTSIVMLVLTVLLVVFTALAG